MEALPTKLKVDSIVEALFEVRFASTEIAEVVIAKLLTAKAWSEYAPSPLPASDIPAPMRKADPNLCYLPTVELRSSDGTRIVRIGERVLSTHCLRPYSTWKVWGPEVFEACDLLFAAGIKDLNIERLALRYVNAFTYEEHQVSGISDLRLKIEVGAEGLNCPMFLFYRREHPSNLVATVRIASKEYVSNPQPPNQTALVDVDVSSSGEASWSDASEIHRWLDTARLAEKTEYFSLFTDEMRTRLVEA